MEKDDVPGSDGHPEAKRIDGRWILLGFPIVAFGTCIVAALIIGHTRLVWTSVGLSVFWSGYLIVLEIVHRRS